MIKSLEWTGNSLRIIDQTELPDRMVYRKLTRVEEVFEAIRKLRVRGAPAIGVAAAYGLYLGLKEKEIRRPEEFVTRARELTDYLLSARPTAVNLHWALQKILNILNEKSADIPELLSCVLETAIAIHKDDQQRCEEIASHGARLIEDGITILTHCNTGALATTGIGTAFGAIYKAHQQGKKIRVYVDETRPLLQGARLTMWELKEAGIPATLITDNMAAYAMRKGFIDLVIVGADRIAANGDVANKIGTYNLAVNSHYHQIPFYVAAPLSTFDFSLPSGDTIPIEERDCREVTRIWDRLSITVEGSQCWNPAFDVTPAGLITGIITEKGVATQPFAKSFIDLNLKNSVHQNQKELIL